MILIKNGFIIEDDKLVKKDVLLNENIIVKIEENIDKECETYDATGCLVMPGAVDVHVHLREPGFTKKETVKTGTMSSAKGGVTSIMSMPNLNPCPHNLENVNVQLDIIKKDEVVNVYPFGSVTVNEEDKELLEKYNNQEKIYKVSKKELVECKGIGEEYAKNIMN